MESNKAKAIFCIKTADEVNKLIPKGEIFLTFLDDLEYKEIKQIFI